MQDLRTRLDKTQAKIDALPDEQGSTVESESELHRLQQLRKNLKTHLTMQKKRWKLFKNNQKTQWKNKQLLTNSEKRFLKKKERNTLEEGLNSTKTLNDLKEQEAELQKQN